MQHYFLFYDTAPDYLERRGQYRNAHLTLAWQAHERGELILGGALGDPIDGAILLFQGDSPDVAANFAQSRSLRAERRGHTLARAAVADSRRRTGQFARSGRGLTA